MILVVTRSDDLSADLVVRHLRDRHDEYLRLDTDRLGTAACHFGFDNEPFLRIGDRRICSADITAIWARRFAHSSNVENIEERYREFCRRELATVMSAFLDSSPALQINSFMADRLSGNRLVQSARARTVGMQTPTMLVTQDAYEAQTFAEETPCVTKAISFGQLISRGGSEEIAFTSAVAPDADFTSISNCPVLLQQKINAMHDWRVTTVGREVFSARASRQDRDNYPTVDWRSEPLSAKFEPATLPQDVQNRLLQLCELSRITFGAHDFVEDRSGQFFFLETNPAGQWGWLELQLGFPIGETLARNLRQGL